MDASSMVSMVGWFVQVTFDKFLSSKLEAWASRSGLHHDVKSLRLRLRMIKALLGTLKGRLLDNEDLLELLAELKDAAYSAEDLLDELEYYRLQELVENGDGNQVGPSSTCYPLQNVMNACSQTSEFLCNQANKAVDIFASNLVPHHSHGGIQSSPPNINMDVHETSRRIKETVENFTRIGAGVKDVLSLENLVTFASKQPLVTKPLRETSSFLTVPKIFGRDKERDHIIELLTVAGESGGINISVLPIVGNGGVGKTSLAQLVYNHPRVVEHFDLRMWTCVSDQFDEFRLTRDMLEYASNCRHEDVKNLNRLQEILKDRLMARSFLLVLDDMWNDGERRKWETFCAPLKCGQLKGGKILATTRMGSVAKTIGTMEPFNLDGLADEEFWSFFKSCAFGDERHDEHPKLQRIGKEIAGKMKGYPLAAKTVGGLLKENLDDEHWMRILESDVWKFQEGPDDIMPVLRLSYQNLPVHLQRCFAFCSLYPKDYQFDEDNLVCIWIAQGLVQPQDTNRRLEDVGKDYFNNLLCRSFFQLLDYGSSRSSYVMHDLLHDLALYVSSEESFVFDGRKSTKIPKIVYHLSIIRTYPSNLNQPRHILSDKEDISNLSMLKTVLEIKNLRTLMFFGGCKYGFDLLFQDTFQGLEKIRVLDLSFASWWPMEKVLDAIKYFIHLRYLDLHFSHIRTLPDSLCKLYHLQVLNLRDCYHLCSLPKGMNNLINLRHLFVHTALSSRIYGIGKLTCLQELGKFHVKKESGYDIGQLKDMNELRGSLIIGNLENVENKEEANKARLKEKRYINKLALQWDDRYNVMLDVDADVLDGLQPHYNLKHLDIDNYMGAKSPEWMNDNGCIPNLETIRLTNCMNWERIPLLGQLSFLKSLHMVNMHSIKQVDCEIFPSSLEELWFENMLKLEKWSGRSGNQLFPCLRVLVILSCPNLSIIPPAKWSGVEDSLSFPCLCKLEIRNCPRLMGFHPLLHTSMLRDITIINVGLVSTFRLCGSPLLSSSGLELHIENCLNLRGIGEGYFQHNLLRDLEKLTIEGCEELISFTSEPFPMLLKELTVKDCPQLKALPPIPLGLFELHIKGVQLSYLPVLRGEWEITPTSNTTSRTSSSCLSTLRVVNCPKLSTLSEGLLRQQQCLTALTELAIIQCENCVSLPKYGFQKLVSLMELRIQSCPKLSLPEELNNESHLLPPSLECLFLDSCGAAEKLLSRSLSTLTSLSSLTISGCPRITTLILHPLAALKSLFIQDCEELVSLDGLLALTSLNRLSLSRCPKVATSSYTLPVQGRREDEALPSLGTVCLDNSMFLAVPLIKSLTSLQELIIGERFMINPQVTDFTREQEVVFHHLISLQSLCFYNCPYLQSLPEELYSLTSLQELEIGNCPGISSLPERGLPISLKQLCIWTCSEELRARCLEDGADWHKIACIPDIKFY